MVGEVSEVRWQTIEKSTIYIKAKRLSERAAFLAEKTEMILSMQPCLLASLFMLMNLVRNVKHYRLLNGADRP